ncbi:MAG: hypothetical protein ACOCT9_00180 [archaeon]
MNGNCKIKINGISYPVSEEFKKMIERKRKEYSKKMGTNITQTKFTDLVAKGKIKI